MKRAPKIGSPLTIVLRQQGCVYCDLCGGFMPPEHTQHWHVAAVDVIVGGVGSVQCSPPFAHVFPQGALSARCQCGAEAWGPELFP